MAVNSNTMAGMAKVIAGKQGTGAASNIGSMSKPAKMIFKNRRTVKSNSTGGYKG